MRRRLRGPARRMPSRQTRSLLIFHCAYAGQHEPAPPVRMCRRGRGGCSLRRCQKGHRHTRHVFPYKSSLLSLMHSVWACGSKFLRGASYLPLTIRCRLREHCDPIFTTGFPLLGSASLCESPVGEATLGTGCFLLGLVERPRGYGNRHTFLSVHLQVQLAVATQIKQCIKDLS